MIIKKQVLQIRPTVPFVSVNCINIHTVFDVVIVQLYMRVIVVFTVSSICIAILLILLSRCCYRAAVTLFIKYCNVLDENKTLSMLSVILVLVPFSASFLYSPDKTIFMLHNLIAPLP